MRMKRNKAFTILELLVVVAIIAILAVIAIPNFIGRIDDAKSSQDLAEINAVEKAVSMYYADNGFYPTLQGKDGSLLQPQPILGSPHNIDFSSLVPNYLATLPHFSYWWVDYRGDVYHTQKTVGTVVAGVFTPTADYTYTLYKTNGTTQVLSASYTLQTGEYILGADADGIVLPRITTNFKNAKVHPESGEYVANPAVMFGASSLYNTGAATYVSIAHTSSLTYGVGNWTLDTWLKPISGDMTIYDKRSGNTQSHMVYTVVSDGRLLMNIAYAGSSSWSASNVTLLSGIQPNVWQHIAIVRNGATITAYLNGVAGTPFNTGVNSVGDTTAPVIIGAYGVYTNYLNGYMDEYRVSTGIARWIGNFTPQTQPYVADANTAMLLHFDVSDKTAQ